MHPVMRAESCCAISESSSNRLRSSNPSTFAADIYSTKVEVPMEVRGRWVEGVEELEAFAAPLKGRPSLCRRTPTCSLPHLRSR